MFQSPILRIALTVEILAIAASAFGQVRTYDVRRAPAPPSIDGVVTAGEWSAAGAEQGAWGELLQLSPPDFDTANNRFQMMWDDTHLYLLYRTNQSAWAAAPAASNPAFDFINDQLFLYFDPNLDNEANATTIPDEFVDGYELAFNQPSGNRVSTNANRQGVGFSTMARVDSIFGDQADWNQGGDPLMGAALGGTVVAQRNGASGGVAEVRIPWSTFNASSTYRGPNPAGDYTADGRVDAADYTRWRDTLGQSVAVPGGGSDGNADGLVNAADLDFWRARYNASGIVETGLNHPFAPTIGDVWFFNMGQISTADTANLMPVYNWTEAFFFAARPHAEITFIGAAGAVAATAVPEPPAALLMLAIAAPAMAWRLMLRCNVTDRRLAVVRQPRAASVEAQKEQRRGSS